MIDPDSSATGALAATAAALLGVFRWLTGRQIARIDKLEKWQLEVTATHSAMKTDLATVKGQVNEIHKMLMGSKR